MASPSRRTRSCVVRSYSVLVCLGLGSFFCRLPDGDEVNFYQVIPLYREEIQYKLEHGSDALLDLCPDESLEVINPHRLNVVTGPGENQLRPGGDGQRRRADQEDPGASPASR